MKTSVFGICAAMACFVAAGAAMAEDDAEPQSNADVLRQLMIDTEVTYKEISEGDKTKFIFHLSSDDDSMEVYRCTAFVEEGDFYAYCMAELPLTIPSNRLDAIAETLTSWNGMRECGHFGLDFNRRGAFFVATIPVDSLREKDALMSLTLMVMPAYCVAEKDAILRAVAGGAAPPIEDCLDSDEDDEDESIGEAAHDAHAVRMEIGGADAEVATPVAAEESAGAASEEATGAASGDGTDNLEIDVPVEDKILKWLVSRGVDPMVASQDSDHTTFQFHVGLTHEKGLFTDATVQITIRERWVSVFVSPNLRVPAKARKAMSKALLKASNEVDGITFMWLRPSGRFAARIVVPDTFVDKNPAHAMVKLLNLAGRALNRHSAELVSALAVSENAEEGKSDDGEEGLEDSGEDAKEEGNDDSVDIPLDEAMALVKSIAEEPAAGGRPLPDSGEPLASRYWNARQAYVVKRLGLPEAVPPTFPALAAVTNATVPTLDCAERFEAAVQGRLALFPDGEIRWTEDGANGLSLVETDRRINDAQIAAVREATKGCETANDDGTLWCLDDNFVFGYATGLDEKRPDKLHFLFLLRKELGGAPPMTMFILDFAPSRAIADSIMGAFLGDKAAQENTIALKYAGIVRVIADLGDD